MKAHIKPYFTSHDDRFPLPDVDIGDRIVLRYNKGNSNNCTYHVRGFVDGRVILARYQRSRQDFTYTVESGVWWAVNEKYCKIVRGRR